MYNMKVPVFDSNEYKMFLAEVVEHIRQSQYNATQKVNNEIISLYWFIGKMVRNKIDSGWGNSVVENLSKDIQREYPGISGFGKSNIWNMAKFYSEYSVDENLQPLVGEISWAKHIVILTKCKESLERKFYILATSKFGWTKDLLVNKIELNTYYKFLSGQTNFEQTLPESVRKQAYLAFKDNYFVGYEGLDDEHSEYELENTIIRNITTFLSEFGPDVAFISNQYRLEVDDQEYFVDIMLYHRRLQSLIAVELKIGDFKPEYKGKMEFYLNVINDKVRLPHENPAIGIIICKSKSRTTVDYALRNSSVPIGVATYSLTTQLPENYMSLLPNPQQIADKLDLLK